MEPRPLDDEILFLVGKQGAMQRYEVLKRYAASVHDIVVRTIDNLVHTGVLSDDGVFLRVVR